MPSPVASSSSGGARSVEPVIRHGFVIPSIRLTPPDSRPAKALGVPEQDLGKYSLYVPLRTEEIGWEEGGIVWANVYAYPTVNLYGGDDDHVIGTYRGGPKGYSFFSITDANFSVASSDDTCQDRSPVAPARKADEPRPRRETGDEIESDRASSSSSSRSSSSRSTAASSEASVPLAPVITKPTLALPAKVIDEAPQVESPVAVAGSDPADALAAPACLTPLSSASSSRRGSSSSDEASGTSTGATTPLSAVSSMDVNEKEGVDAKGSSMSAKLTEALAQLERQAELQMRLSAEETEEPTAAPSDEPLLAKLASRVGTVPAPRSTNADGSDKVTQGMRSTSFSLDAAGPGEERTWPAGRGNSGYTSRDFCAGWSYEDSFDGSSA